MGVVASMYEVLIFFLFFLSLHLPWLDSASSLIFMGGWSKLAWEQGMSSFVT